MANQHRQRLRGLRNISDDLWDEMEAATALMNTDRSAVSRQFYEWYTGRTGAELPVRPSERGQEA